jgi:hypothetical protein
MVFLDFCFGVFETFIDFEFNFLFIFKAVFINLKFLFFFNFFFSSVPSILFLFFSFFFQIEMHVTLLTIVLNLFIRLCKCGYYISDSGTDSTVCTSNSVLYCKTFEYVLYNLTFPKDIYIQPGNYTFKNTQTISNTSFSVSGYTLLPYGIVSSTNTMTFPLILFSSFASISFHIIVNESTCFWFFVKIIHGFNSLADNCILKGFFFFN